MKETNKSHSKNLARKNTITIIFLVLAFVVVFFGGYFSHYLFDNKSITVSRDIIRILQSVSYVIDPTTGELKEITYEDIADSIVDGLNDKYAEYYTKEEYEQRLPAILDNFERVQCYRNMQDYLYEKLL